MRSLRVLSVAVAVVAVQAFGPADTLAASEMPTAPEIREGDQVTWGIRGTGTPYPSTPLEGGKL